MHTCVHAHTRTLMCKLSFCPFALLFCHIKYKLIMWCGYFSGLSLKFALFFFLPFSLIAFPYYQTWFPISVIWLVLSHTWNSCLVTSPSILFTLYKSQSRVSRPITNITSSTKYFMTLIPTVSTWIFLWASFPIYLYVLLKSHHFALHYYLYNCFTSLPKNLML